MEFKLDIFRLTAPVYWILVSLHSGYSPTLKDDFVVTISPHTQLVPIYYMTYNESLYIVLSQNQESTVLFSIKNRRWKKVYQNNNNSEIIKSTSFDVSEDYLQSFSTRSPNPVLFNSTFNSIPSQYAPPEYVRSLFLNHLFPPLTSTSLPPLTTTPKNSLQSLTLFDIPQHTHTGSQSIYNITVL
nr:hypothetical protein [Abalone asfa-like virus]